MRGGGMRGERNEGGGEKKRKMREEKKNEGRKVK